jgi:Fic family protein
MADTQEGVGKTPGEFRKTQNWIGGTRPDSADFVPPPPRELNKALADIEKFLNLPQPYSPLIKAALLHAQFETIHPFLDGNGRTGRLLIALQLHHDKMLEYPVLYLSEYFKRHRDVYFDRLSDYHNRGEVERWVLFFLEGVTSIAEEAIQVSKKLVALREKDMTLAHSLGGKQAKTAIKLLEGLFGQPIVDVAKVEEITGLSRPAANALVKKFVDIDILQQVDEADTYGRQFAYVEYLTLFHEPEIRRKIAEKESK